MDRGSITTVTLFEYFTSFVISTLS